MKFPLLALSLALLPAYAAATPFGDFQNRVTSANLKPFALDLGGVLGGAAFHSGRALGFPGFDVGLVGTIQARPTKENTILRDSGVQRIGIPMIQAAVGLPFKFDVIAQGTAGAGARVFGGGLRWGVVKSGMLSPLPDISISGFADRVNHTNFNATHFSLNAAASFHLPIVHPFLGLGVDFTKVTVGSSAGGTFNGASASARGSRITAGVEVSPLPLFHIHGAYTLLHGISGLDLGMGVRF